MRTILFSSSKVRFVAGTNLMGLRSKPSRAGPDAREWRGEGSVENVCSRVSSGLSWWKSGGLIPCFTSMLVSILLVLCLLQAQLLGNSVQQRRKINYCCWCLSKGGRASVYVDEDEQAQARCPRKFRHWQIHATPLIRQR